MPSAATDPSPAPPSSRFSGPRGIRRYLSFWMILPAAVCLFILWQASVRPVPITVFPYQGMGSDTWDHPPSVEEVIASIKRGGSESEFWKKNAPTMSADQRQILMRSEQRDIAAAAKIRADIISRHDFQVAMSKADADEIRALYGIALVAFLFIPVTPWFARKIGSLLRPVGTAVDAWFKAPPEAADPNRRMARIKFVGSDRTYGQTFFLVGLVISVIMLLTGYPILQSGFATPGVYLSSHPGLLILGGTFLIGGFSIAIVSLKFLVKLSRIQTQLDAEAAQRVEQVQRFTQQTAHGAAVVDTGAKLAADDDEFRIDLPPGR